MAAASEPASSRGLRRFCRQVKSGAGAACEVGRCAACERALRALVSRSKKQKLLLLLTASAASEDRKSTRLNSSHVKISYAVFCLKKKKKTKINRNRIN